MKLQGAIDLHVAGEQILREPNFWDKVRRRFGGEPDLRTDRMSASLEAAAVVEAVRKALSKIGVTNAVSLVIDNQVLFQDLDGKPDDLGDLFLAFADQESVFGAGFDMLRLAVEHQEAGLHLVAEVIARTEHPADEAAARIVVSGRIRDFEPRRGEDADAYRARVEPLTRDASTVEVARRQFESFVDRVADAMRAAMPEARVVVREAHAQVIRPSTRPSRERPAPAPTDPRYDPYDRYYGSPLDTMLSVMMWSSLLSWGTDHHSHVTVVNDHGDTIGTGDQAAAGDLDGSDHDGGDQDGGDAGDAGGDSDFGGGDSDFGGGDSDFGGDFGGGDLGGGDF